jgi:hypothetical protein
MSGSCRIGSGVSGGLSIDGLEGSGGVAIEVTLRGLDADYRIALDSTWVQLLLRVPYLITKSYST